MSDKKMSLVELEAIINEFNEDTPIETLNEYYTIAEKEFGKCLGQDLLKHKLEKTASNQMK